MEKLLVMNFDSSFAFLISICQYKVTKKMLYFSRLVFKIIAVNEIFTVNL